MRDQKRNWKTYRRQAELWKEEEQAKLKQRDELKAKPESLYARLAALEAELSTIDSTQVSAAAEINSRIETTAWLAAYATQELHDCELARRAWKVNSQLLNLIDYSAFNSEGTINSRIVSVLLRDYLSEEDWDFLRTGGSLAELQPKMVPSETWKNLIRMSATVLLERTLERPAERYFPPAAWLASG